MPSPQTCAESDASRVAPGPLAGMRVVMAGSFVAVPSAGMTLAQLGADVIRIDPIGGGADAARWPVLPNGSSLYWTGLNRGVRSVCIDTRSPAGRHLAQRLICASGPEGGVLLTNSGGRGWLAYEALARERADLIQVEVQGFADGRPAIDYTVNAAAGFPGVTGPEGWAYPVNHILPAWDLLTGMMAALGVVAADRERQSTGRGRRVTVALADVAMAAAANLGLLAEAQLLDVERRPQGNYVYGTFGVDMPTGDDRRVMVVPLTGRQWRQFLDVTGQTETVKALEVALRTDFDDEGARYLYREVLAAVFRPWFEERSLDQVTKALDGIRVPCAPYRSFREIVDGHLSGTDPQRTLATVDQPGVGAVLASRLPLHFHPEPQSPPALAPRLGEHTGEVLGEVLGLGEIEIGELSDAGVVATPV